MPSREIGEQMRTCFEKAMGASPTGSRGSDEMMSPDQTGPGGCRGPEECGAYCESNPEECQEFQPGPGVSNPAGQMMPQQSGPGGCKGPEECQAYCESNPEQCGDFHPPISPDGQQQNMQNAPNVSNRPEEMMSGQSDPSGCATPEECQQQIQQQAQQQIQQQVQQQVQQQAQQQIQQQIQQQVQQQYQNQMIPPTICEGENCKQDFIPQQFDGQEPVWGGQIEGQQPIWEGQQEKQLLPPDGDTQFIPQSQYQDSSIIPQSQIYQEFQQPPIDQQPLMENIAPAPSMENIIPSSDMEPQPVSNAPAKKSLLKSLLGTISAIFAQLLKL